MSRLEKLIGFLTALSQVQASGHYVNKEIKEVTEEIMKELGMRK